jgi:hypothetical protein
LTLADIAMACRVLAMRAEMRDLARVGRFARLDAVVRRAEGLGAFVATRG